ncbi:hypothetical protein TRFO_24191 [Tritrichomonas foetus]|uniref:Wntless-like transmembrane domain-containing protein n=1 Tax=Tritrichomonas foetus TaxID=1144522 RepID=A0A1J4KD34_9EUKA|nr:hypothetical protein TRFO_24191 [Tritrichomonas foetus]|eukprot:OHT07612.1 hypothetical protein TRFO_24191 [Tritrichomonas foetus]
MKIKSKKEIHSDKLIDIQIADENEQETLMAIETDSPKDDILPIILFFTLIASTTFAGIYGPPLYNVEFFRFRFEKNPPNIFNQHIPGITSQQQFFIMQLSFNSQSRSEYTELPVEFNYIMIFKNSRNEEVRRETGNFADKVILQPFSTTTEPLHFFFDRFISYDQLDIRIDFTKSDNIEEAILSATSGDGGHLKYQFYVRLLFVFAASAIFILFYARLQTLPKKNWLLEQKFTLTLQIFSIIGANPLFWFYINYPSILQDIVNTLVSRIFTCFVFFYILVILDNVVIGNRKDRTCFFIPKAIFFSFHLIIEILYPIMYHGLASLGVEALPHAFVFIFRYTRIILNFVFIIWFMYLTFKGFLNTDSTEHSKLIVYTIVFTATLIINLCDIFLTNISLFQNTSGLFSLKFSSLYGFVILMVFFHWPYETSIDQQYNDPELDNDPKNIFESDDGK